MKSLNNSRAGLDCESLTAWQTSGLDELEGRSNTIQKHYSSIVTNQQHPLVMPRENNVLEQVMVSTTENEGVVTVSIAVREYGQAGEHWRDVLRAANHGGYGKIYIQRFGANKRRYYSCYSMRDIWKGNKGANLDECPGAMFIWTTDKPAHVEAIDAIDNQKLGRELGLALRKYKQNDENDLWEVYFRFV